MDYSQFLALKQEIGLLIVFLLVFLNDTFASPKSAKAAIGCFPNFFADLIKFTFSPDIFKVLGLN